MEVIESPLKKDSGKGRTIVEGNRQQLMHRYWKLVFDAPLWRTYGRRFAYGSGSIADAHYILARTGGGPELESAGACRRAVRRNLGAALFSTLSLIIASVVKTRERFMGIGQVLTMPLFFASNAIYPASIMPFWLQTVAHANPLTYEVARSGC